ncbi:MAG: arginine--tRNA ligase [Candidatus Aminicenantes bacterium]|nr:arginine--tRNA ligase [Candidatus Aminicenantes bacterium]MDH5743764.1 arginine--tRNA ligase [Candidatus Aminicenantes bacterium]
MLKLKASLKEKIHHLLEHRYPLEESMLEIGYTPQARMGDLALTFPFQLAKKLKKQPRELASEIIPHLDDLEDIDKIEVAGPGYINLFLNQKAFFLRQINSLEKCCLQREEKKIIIEHTNINPNKAAHIGHLRNAVLGDTLGRCLEYKGEDVEIQNYIDDTGIQVVDVTLGFMDMEKKTYEDIQNIEGRFDYYCWDLYTQVSSYLEEHPEAQTRKTEILKKIEEGENPEAEMANYISRRILMAHLKTMKRIGVSYDILPCESSILGLRFWEKAFFLLKEKNAISYVEEGLNKGCWVMRLEDEEEREKIIVRSDGTITYVGKDIAYQLWKFGLLEKDFFYEPFTQDKGKTIWITTAVPQPHAPQFGKGTLVYNVIDTRQSYLQKVVIQGLKSLDYQVQARKSIHFSYEMVALSPKSLKELGQKISEEDKDKNFLEVSGRKGLGVKADDLLDRLEQKALKEVEIRNPDIPPEQRADIARQIGTGALRYFMLKFARNSVIVFDFEEALSFEGETGPYLQYTLVRINSIFRNLKEREDFEEKDLLSVSPLEEITLDILKQEERSDFWDLIFYASQFEEEILHSIRSLEFSHLAKFAFNLSQKFNAYYHKYSILAEEDKGIKYIRIWTISYVREILKRVLNLMGIPHPERM